MNEQIKLITEYAGGCNNISKFRGHALPPQPSYIDSTTVDLKKFAELIVMECANIIIMEGMRVADSMPKVDTSNYVKVAQQTGMVSAAIKHSAIIKQHFGIEE